MANVVDVVTELSYNADVTPIEHVNAAFGEQQKLIQGLMRENLALEQQKKRLSDAGITNQTKINALIEQNTKRINEATAAMGKQLATSEKLQASVKRTKTQFDSLSFSLGNLVRDSPYGFTGYANNIGPAFDDIINKLRILKAEGKPTSAIFSAIGASLFGFTGLVNLAVAAIQLFGNQLTSTNEKVSDFATVNKKADESILAQTIHLQALADEVTNEGTSTERLLAIRKELVSDYPALANSLQDETNLRIKLYNSINQVTEALKLQAIIKAAEGLIVEETKKYINGEISTYNAFIGVIKAGIIGVPAALADGAQAAEKEYKSSTDRLFKIIGDAQKKLQTTGLGDLLAKPDKAVKTNSVPKATKSIADLRKEIDELARSINRLSQADIDKWGDELEKKAKEVGRSVQESLGELNKSFTGQLQDEYDSPLSTSESDTLNAQLEIYEAQKKLREKNEEEEKVAAERRKERIVEGVSQANDLIQQVGGILNQIYDAQLNKIDQQITTTNENISKAYELARMGNATYLKEEEDRLDALQKKREDTAEKQMKLNALLMASQQALNLTEAIGAIVSAAAKGDPYTIALRIAAAVAALIGGVAAIQGAFAEGVVDFQGKGTGKSDSNVVRISKGESVITAEATQKYKPMLAAMNAGTFTAMPVSTQSVSRTEMNGVHERLDTLIEVMEQSHTTVNNSMDDRGWVSMTERATRRNQNRFR